MLPGREICKTVNGDNVWIYPYKISNPKGTLRTHEDTQKICIAFKEDKLVYGVKYSTCLHRLKYFDLVDSATCMELCWVFHGT